MSPDYWIARIRAEGIVREQDVLKAAENAYRAHMTRMSMRAAEARRAKKREREEYLRKLRASRQ
ncbi:MULTISPECIES: hypothetical protein [Streptosporangium]|uniref:hypothetical protein n=1 Tax=Streptosporangium TaxID=2000 RepID=UPI0031F79EB8